MVEPDASPEGSCAGRLLPPSGIPVAASLGARRHYGDRTVGKVLHAVLVNSEPPCYRSRVYAGQATRHELGPRRGENDDGKRESRDRLRRAPRSERRPSAVSHCGISRAYRHRRSGPRSTSVKEGLGTRGVGKPPLSSCGAFPSVTGVRPVTLKVPSGEESANCPFTFPERP